jgi:hypothetical protein
MEGCKNKVGEKAAEIEEQTIQDYSHIVFMKRHFIFTFIIFLLAVSNSSSQRNYSLYFNGNHRGSIIIVPFYSLQNSYMETRALTFEAWVKPMRVDTGANIVNKAIGACKDNWVLGDEGKLSLLFGTSNNCSGGFFASRKGGLTYGVWQHIAGVWDGDTLRTFVNGLQIATTFYNGIPVANDIDMSVGANNHWNGDYVGFRGFIDEVRYSNCARYKNSFTPEKYLEADSNTVFLYHFDEGIGKTVHDASFNSITAQGKEIRWSTDTPDNHYGEYAPNKHTALLLHLNETNGLISHDASKGQNDGRTVRNLVTHGRFVRAKKVVVAEDRVVVKQNPLLDFTKFNEFTTECWLLIASMPKDTTVVLMKKDGEWSLLLLSSGKVQFQIQAGGQEHNRISEVETPRPLTLNKWIHLAAGWRGTSQNQILHVDGNLVSSISNAVRSIVRNQSPLYIGDVGIETHAAFSIDEIRISDAALASSAFNLPIPPVEIKAEWRGKTVQIQWEHFLNGIGTSHYNVYRGTDSISFVYLGSTTAAIFYDSSVAERTSCYYQISEVDSTNFESIRLHFAKATTGRFGTNINEAIIIGIGTTVLLLFVGYLVLKRKQTSQSVDKLTPAIPLERKTENTVSLISLLGGFHVTDSS